MTKVRKKYTPAFKLEMIKLIEEQGQKPSDVATQYEIAESTLENWLTRYRREKRGNPISKGNVLTEELSYSPMFRPNNHKIKIELS